MYDHVFRPVTVSDPFPEFTIPFGSAVLKDILALCVQQLDRCLLDLLNREQITVGKASPAKEMTDSSTASFRISLIKDLGTSAILSEKIFPMVPVS